MSHSPVQQREIYRITLAYAFEIARTEDVLAIRLKVPVEVLKAWLQGIEAIPAAAFHDAIDVILTATPGDLARTREATRHIGIPYQASAGLSD